MDERTSTRHGQDASHQVLRFELVTALQPNASAQARIVWFNASSGTNDYQAESASLDSTLRIDVFSTFYRSFGLIGERGWALYWPDSNRWEVISMEGSLVRPGTAYAPIAAGAVGLVMLSNGTTTVSAANQSVATIQVDDPVTVYYDPKTQQWYAIGSGEDLLRHGQVSSDVIHPAATGGVNTVAGAVTATNQSGVSMYDGDYVTVYKDAGYWYAINYGTEIYPLFCPSPGVDGGDDIDIDLPDGRTVTATNGSDHFIATDASISVYLDRFNKSWWIIPTDTIVPRMLSAEINMDSGLNPASADPIIDNLKGFDGRPAPKLLGVAITHVDNPLKLAARDNDIVIIQEDLSGFLSPLGWFILAVQSKFRRRLKAQINNAAGLQTDDADATVDTVTSFDGGSVPSIVSAANTLKLFGSDNDIAILEEVTSANPPTWFVAEIQPQGRTPREFKGSLNGAITNASTTAYIDGLLALDGGSAPASVTAANFLGWAGDDNDYCLVVEDWSGGSVDYLLRFVEWDVVVPAVNIFTAATNLLRQTKRPVLGKAAAASVDSTIDTGTTC